MLRKVVWIVVILPVAALIVALAVANRERVTLLLDPFGSDPALAFTAPLFLMVLVSLLLGMLIGGGAAWLKQGKWRRKARAGAREAARWREEAERLRGEAAAQGAQPEPVPPALNAPAPALSPPPAATPLRHMG